MDDASICETHAWASIGVTARAGSICRIWACESCPTWTAEPLEPDHERRWDETWLAEH
jgi:hypothetical protein